MLPPAAALQNTAVSFPPTSTAGPALYVIDIQRGPILAPRGSKWREAQLRFYDKYDFSSMWQGARSGIVKKLSNVAWHIEGPPNEVQYFQDVLGYAQFGHGWEYLQKMVLRDYLTQAYGGIYEIAGPGEPDQPLVEAPTGLNHLDAGRCYVTGNPIYPLLYYSLWDGKLHKMHASRVYMLVDDPDPDERYFGIGTCALERAIAINQREVRIGQYIDGLLDDKPQPGLLTLTGASDQNWQQLVAKYLVDQQSDERPVFGRTMVITSIDPNATVKAEVIPFAQTPEKFSFKDYTDIDVSALALALGIDRQELWELAGRGIGSGSQSAVLAMKSRAKLYGDVLTGIERFMNWAFLPESCQFKFVEHDAQQDVTQTAIDLQLAQLAQTLAAIPGVSPLEIKKLLAARSDTYKDAMTDPMGRIILPSEDPQPAAQIEASQPTVTNETPVAGGPPASAAPKAPTGQLVTQQITKKFDPNQLRDDSGKWSETGAGEGSSAKPDSPRSVSPDSTPGTDTHADMSEWERQAQVYASPLNSRYGKADQKRLREATGHDAADYLRAAGVSELPSKDMRATITPVYDDKWTPKGFTRGPVKSVIVTVENPTNKEAFPQLSRTFHFDENGKPSHIVNDHFYLPPGETGSGLGTRVFHSQVGQASQMGFSSIKTLAGKSKSMNGYYTWPRLGYDATVSVRGKKTQLSDLMRTPEGRDYWKKNGKQMDMSFDLSPNGRSRQILDAYYQERFSNVAVRSRLKASSEQADDPRLSPEEDALLDKIWDEIEFDDAEQLSDGQTKAFSSTAAEFVTRFASIIQRAADGSLRRNQAESLALGLLLSSGTKAFTDGLSEGGVSEMDDDDQAAVQDAVIDAIDYLDPLLDSAFAGTLPADQAEARAELWANKTLTDLYNAGRVSADKNGYYTWKLGKTEQHCPDCERLTGQVHRFKDWYSRDWIPQGNRLSCGGWRCDCKLVKTTGPGQGSF